MALFGALVPIRLPPVTFLDFLSKLKKCFKSKSVLFIGGGRKGLSTDPIGKHFGDVT